MNENPRRLHTLQAAATSSTAFRAYLERYGLSLLDVALAAQVRLLSVWNVQQGIPVRSEHATAIRTGLYKLTGEPYIGHIDVIPESIIYWVDHRSPQSKNRKGRTLL